MAPHIPDEILSEILGPALRVPDSLFAQSSATTFATYSESTSSLLVVCKDWLRVSTPLLYNVVVLRSNAQVRALDATLKRNTDLGRFIKKLRVEGGFGVAMHGILLNAPNVTDLFISLQIRSGDSCSGLLKGLPLINPRRVIIADNDMHPLKNKQVEKLEKTLEECAIRKWTNLARTAVVFPYIRIPSSRLQMVSAFTLGAQSVTTLSFPYECVAYGGRSLSQIQVLAEQDNIQYVELRGTRGEAHLQSLIHSVPEHWSSRSKMRIDPSASHGAVTKAPVRTIRTAPRPSICSTNPDFVPMASTPAATVNSIWHHVLSFAMSAPPPNFPFEEADWILNDNFMRTASCDHLRYLLVSKRFYKLGLPFLYRSPVIIAPKMFTFAGCVQARPVLGQHIKELYISNASLATIPNQRPVFVHTGNLTKLIGDSLEMDWPTFYSLAESAGSTLVELCATLNLPKRTSEDMDGMEVEFETINFTVLSCFTALRILNLHLEGDIPENCPIIRSGFQALEDIRLFSFSGDEGIYEMFAQMELPRLRRVDGVNANMYSFLDKHGHKILECTAFHPQLREILSRCPSLKTMTVDLGHRQFSHSETGTFSLSYPPTHNALESIFIEKGAEYYKNKEETAWNNIFAAMKPADFPALREIRIPQCVWPKTENEIRKSYWVKWSDRLFDQQIKVTDKMGTHWRPRLKRSRR